MKNENIIIIILVALLFLFVLGWPVGSYGIMGSYWAGAWSFMWIFMILIWALVITFLVLGIIWLIKQIQKK